MTGFDNIQTLLENAHKAELHILPGGNRFTAVLRSDDSDLCVASGRTIEHALERLEGEAGDAILKLWPPE